MKSEHSVNSGVNFHEFLDINFFEITRKNPSFQEQLLRCPVHIVDT